LENYADTRIAVFEWDDGKGVSRGGITEQIFSVIPAPGYKLDRRDFPQSDPHPGEE
jgi:hypothetical protein